MFNLQAKVTASRRQCRPGGGGLSHGLRRSFESERRTGGCRGFVDEVHEPPRLRELSAGRREEGGRAAGGRLGHETGRFLFLVLSGLGSLVRSDKPAPQTSTPPSKKLGDATCVVCCMSVKLTAEAKFHKAEPKGKSRRSQTLSGRILAGLLVPEPKTSLKCSLGTLQHPPSKNWSRTRFLVR